MHEKRILDEWLGHLLIKTFLIHVDLCRCLRYISILEIGRFLHLFPLPTSPLKLGWRLSAFNNLHEFCVLTFYAEQTSAKTKMMIFMQSTDVSGLSIAKSDWYTL